MRVKRLEVQGFKSFKDKTVVHFDHGITGIVGPNGCGKSNIVDAFFWVMGEQSYKHIRGNSSDDLIFNGSSKYTAMGMAEATLVMETEEVDTERMPSGASAHDEPLPMKKKEISVTRRVYRSGEGEYFVNGQPARLKDIHELFMDTGVGAKGYSVIEQGQIGKVVNAKPEERRLLIEEAAGVAKYKARKKESLRKVESAQGNLARLADVLAEIERGLESLERQAQKARRYQEYQRELFEKEVTWGRRRIKVLNTQSGAMTSERQILDQDLAGLRAELSTAETTIETERVIQTTENKRSEDFQTQIQQMSSDLTHEQSALELSRRRQEDLELQIFNLNAERLTLSQALEIEKEKVSAQLESSIELETSHETSRARASELDASVRGLRAQVDALRVSLEGSRRELMDGVAKGSDFHARKAMLDGLIQSSQSQKAKVQEKRSELTQKLTLIEEEKSKLLLALDEAKNGLSVAGQTLAEQKNSLTAVKQKVSELEQAREAALRSATQLRSKLQSLEELSAALEGIGDGPKAVLEWARQSGHGSQLKFLADAIKIIPGYELAAEGFLESKLELLISLDLELSLESLRQIRESKSGRAAIAQLGALSAYSVASDRYSDLNDVQRALTQSGVESQGLLSQFIQVEDASLSDWINDSLLRRVIVVKDFDRALPHLKLAQENSIRGWSFVSMDGFVLDADGTLRGGSTESEQSGSLLGRKRLMQELQSQVQVSESALSESVEALSQAKSQAVDQESLISDQDRKLRDQEFQMSVLAREEVQLGRQNDEVIFELSMIDQDLIKSDEQIVQAREEQIVIDETLSALVLRKTELESLLQNSDLELTTLASDLQLRDSELQSIRMQEISFKERSQGIKREIETARSFITSRENRLAEIIRLVDRVRDERQGFSGGEASHVEKIETLSRELQGAQADLAQVKNRLETSNASLSQRLEQLKILSSDIEKKSQRLNHLAVEAERIAGELSFIVRNLEEKHGAGCLEQVSEQADMDNPIVTTEMSEEEEKQLFEDVEALKRKMQNLGNVNLGALEEFETTQARFENLCKEKLDLEKSIEDLNAAIEHINKTSEERFKTAFEAIADRFERLFPIIFGGGQAQLSLVFPEGSQDILEAGVDILASPPGKRIQNMSVLSGGEKALTAISLIFAIFMVKPSPFCVLDEVDAPLDDSNIGKFNGVLREMSAKSQFIVITHNKKTMELNDALYGVTMEEPGVSKIVSVELT